MAFTVGESASYACSTDGYVTDNGAKQMLQCKDDGSFDTRQVLLFI